MQASFTSDLFSRMSNDVTIISLVADRVYDDVPKDTAFPYITLGDDTWNDGGDKSNSGHEVTVTIHTWSQYNGRLETLRLQDALYNLIHEKTIPLSVGQVVLSRLEYSTVMRDPDGRTQHGVQRFRFILSSANP
jgi:hypothetical protein